MSSIILNKLPINKSLDSNSVQPKAHDRGLLFNTTPQGSENSVQHMKRMEWISEGEIIMSPDFGEVLKMFHSQGRNVFTCARKERVGEWRTG